MLTSFVAFSLSSLACLLMLGPSAPSVPLADLNRVRPLSPHLDRALVDGYRCSPTLRRLIDELAASDLIIHIVSRVGTGGPTGSMSFVTRAGRHRFLRVTIDSMIGPQTRTAILGHELQHALEVAHARWVVDQASFAELFHDIGFPSVGGSRGESYETRAAQEAGSRVLAEVRRSIHYRARTY